MKSYAELAPGDMVVRTPGTGVNGRHVEIVLEVEPQSSERMVKLFRPGGIVYWDFAAWFDVVSDGSPPR